MATNYPTSLDTATELPAGTTLAAQDLDDFPHSDVHGNANDAIIAIETELGTSPSGSSSTVKARLDDIEARRGCALTAGSGQSLPVGITAISWTTEVQDTDGYITTPGTAVTIPAGLGGIYAISAAVQVSVGATDAEILLYKNGTLTAWKSIKDSNVVKFNLSTAIALAPTDTISVRYSRSSGGGSPTLSAAEFHVYRLSP